MKLIYPTILFFVLSISSFGQSLLDGYTDKLSYRHGDVVTFFIKSDGVNNCQSLGCNLDLLLGDLRGINTNLYDIGNIDVPAGQSITTSNPWENVNGFGYTPSTATWIVPDLSILPSGYYLINGIIPIIIKGDNTSTEDIAIVCPTNTMNAYTTSGGHSLYDFHVQVTFLRPQSRANYSIQDGYFLDWIRGWADIHSKHLNFLADSDLEDNNGAEIMNAKLLIVPGHSEYWTRQARLNFDKFVDAGKHVLILSGNSMWCQVGYEDVNNNPSSHLLSCMRGKNWSINWNDDNTDPLLRTYAWMTPELKYSLLGSIGADWLRGGMDSKTYSAYGSNYFSTIYKILNPNSPIFDYTNTVNFTNNELLLPCEEGDGTLVKTDVNGNIIDASSNTINISTSYSNNDPVLDISALGFYQAEMIGYTLKVPDNPQFADLQHNNNNIHCIPLLIFKKTYNSGTIVNVSSNSWCTNDDTHWDDIRKPITENMINLALDNVNMFYYSAPSKFGITPAYSSISYSLCTSNSSVHFTPHGVYLNNAYKVDSGFTANSDHDIGQPRYYSFKNFIRSASINSNCTNYQELRVSDYGKDNKPKASNEKLTSAVSLFPNPNSGTFTININDKGIGNYTLLVTDVSGRVIEQRRNLVNGNNQVDNNDLSAGLYLWQVYSNNTIIGKGKVSIVKQN